MSHFLSNATQRRLEIRRIDAERTDTPTLRCAEDEVLGHFRCATAAVSNCTSAGDDAVAVWCAEENGSISVRNIDSGDVVASIARKQDRVDSHIFVFCMCSPRHDQVWAGHSDGTIRVYHAYSYHALADICAHTAAITAMCTVNMPTQDDEFEPRMHIVVTASSDWTLAKWDTTTLQCLGKLNGHRVAVKCLAPSASGEFLLSGGEDGVLRMWALMVNTEVVSSSTPPPHATPPRLSRDSDLYREPLAQLDEPRHNAPLWPVRGHRSAVSAAVFLYDSCIATGGFDGLVYIWSLAGVCLHAVEERNCGITSILLDTVCHRMWVGGIDGVLNFYATTAPWEHLGSAEDHCGAYLVAAVPIRQDALQRMWTLDDQGAATCFVEVIQCDASTAAPALGEVSEAEWAAVNEADRLRQQVVSSYAELRQHRTRLSTAEAHERKQREKIVLKFGDNLRALQLSVYRAHRWLLRSQFCASAALRATWFEQCSKRSLASLMFWRWAMWARERWMTANNSTTADLIKAITTKFLKESTARQLKLSLQELRRRKKYATLLESVTRRGFNLLRRRALYKWLRWMLERRKAFAKHFVGGSQSRFDQVASNAVEARTDEHSKFWLRRVQKLEELAAGLHAFNRRSLMQHTYDALRRYVALRKRDRLADALSIRLTPLRRQLVQQYFLRWQRFASLRLTQREVERTPDIQAEVDMWEALIRDASTITAESLAEQIRHAQELAARRAETIGALKEEANGILDAIHEIKSDLVASGLKIAPGLDIPARVDAIFTYMKARGISTHRDVATISSAHSEYSTLPLYVAPPPPAAASKSMSPVRRASSPGASRRPSAPTASARKSPSPAVAKKSAPPPLPKCLINEFGVQYQKLRTAVRAAAQTVLNSESTEHAALPLSLQLLAGLSEKDKILMDDHDWCVHPDAVQHFKRRDIKDCAAQLRKLICLYDCIRCKQEDAASTSSLFAVRPVGPAAAVPMIPVELLRQVLCNAPTMLKLATHDFSLSALEYVSSVPDAVASSQQHRQSQEGAPTRENSAALPRPTTTTESTALRPSSTTAVRRHSSPAASLRRANSPIAPLKPVAQKSVATTRLAAASPAARSPRPSAARPSGAAHIDPEPTANPAAVAETPHEEVPLGDSREFSPPPVLPPSHSVATPPPPPPKKASSPAGKPSLSPRSAAKPFLGFRVAVGPPLEARSRVASITIAECNETYPRDDGSDPISGPAYLAGLRAGDILQRFAGYAVTDLAAFNAIVARHAKVGAAIAVQALDGSTRAPKNVVLLVGSR